MSQILNDILVFFPNGIEHYLLGGIAIGIGVVLIYILTGTIVGASTGLETIISYRSKIEWFQQEGFVSSRMWRTAFTVGIITGAFIYTVISGENLWVTEVQWWRLLFGGILVGIGTRLGKGCTSGHGICGLASVSAASLINVIIFVGVAIVVAHAIEIIGVIP